jgi:hypothetical protein
MVYDTVNDCFYDRFYDIYMNALERFLQNAMTVSENLKTIRNGEQLGRFNIRDVLGGTQVEL